jgi:hypothetical protein
MSTNKNPDYSVGFAKPPEDTRFRKGRSGNPKGRPPRRSRKLSSRLEQALSESVVINENGQRKTITKGEAILKQLVNKGASGDPRAIQMLLGTLRSIDGGVESEPPAEDGLEQADAQMVMLERLTVKERLELRRLIAKAQGEPEQTESDGVDVVAPAAPEADQGQ